MKKTNEANRLFERCIKPNSPGAAAAVLVDGKVVYKNGFGLANMEYDIPNTPSTIFHVASVSKQFTAMCILLLESEGKLNINDDIRKYIPEMPDLGHVITIKHLMHHTSGLRDQWELLFLAGWRSDDVITQEHLLKAIMRQKALNFEPGTKFLYSNTGYTLMAEIVKRVSGKPITIFAKENIFDPLKMDNTHFHDDNDMIVKNRAYSYKLDLEQGYKKSVLNYSTVGATSLFTTAEDLLKWGYNFKTKEIGGLTVIENMKKKYTLKNGETIDYAGGVTIGDYRGLKTVEHSGADAGFRSALMCFPEQDAAIAVLSNLSTFKPMYYAKKLADIFIDEDEFKCEDSFSFSNYYIEEERYENIKDLEGIYMTEPGITFKIEVEDNEMFILMPGTPELKLMYKTGNTYIIKDTDMLIKWEIDEKNNIEGFKIVYPHDENFAKKLNKIEISSDMLKKYEGIYYSDELKTFYKIVLEDETLVAKHNRNEDSKLFPYEKNKFTSEEYGNSLSGDITFKVNQDMQVIGFNITTGRVINLWFMKLR